MPSAEIIDKTGISKSAYNDLYATYKENNLEALSTDLIDTWEMLLRAKLMQTTEKAIDCVYEDLEEGNTRSAKDAATVFQTVFNSFRLSTGKSTENIGTASQRFSEIIESRRRIAPPNQSAKGSDNVIAIS